MKITLILTLVASFGEAALYVCESGDPKFLGTYAEDAVADGAPRFTNEHGKSLYRHSGYWYLGDLVPWPPITSYRCIEGCSHNALEPPLIGYHAKKDIGKTPTPIFQHNPCGAHAEL